MAKYYYAPIFEDGGYLIPGQGDGDGNTISSAVILGEEEGVYRCQGLSRSTLTQGGTAGRVLRPEGMSLPMCDREAERFVVVTPNNFSPLIGWTEHTGAEVDEDYPGLV